MSKEEQRAIVATGIMKYHDSLVHTGEQGLEYVYFTFDSKTICLVDDYHPDLEDNKSLGQARDLKERLRELGVIYSSDWNPDKHSPYGGYVQTDKHAIITHSKLSEGAALLEAASKLAMELAKESNNE